MATITPVTIAGGTPVPFAAASAGGDTIANVGADTTFIVRNAGGGSITATLAGAVTCSQGALHNTAVVCAVGDTEIIVPSATVSPTTGNVAVTYSAVTSVTVAAVV